MTKRITIFGDSIAWGKADVESGGWVNRLRHYVETAHVGTSVYNLGVSGDTTVELLKRFTPECAARNNKTQIIIFAVGINDSCFINTESNPLVSIDNFQSNLRQLAVEAKLFSSSIAFIGPTMVDEDKMPFNAKYYTNDSVEKYNEALENVCANIEVPFLNMLDVLSLRDLPDGLHPDSSGHEKMFHKIKDFLLVNGIV
ncbi:MAG: GDSL-type esterase/lipase family protein [Candidatus Komeilibacteria bacterium]|nr:GDSL-type esterase/lipase family protein [Candidatus Komeilibacteria bacterium]